MAALGSLAADGGAAAAVVVGEPGLGKTRLLAEVAPRLELPCLYVHGYEPAREIALAAAGGLLRELTRAGEPGGRLDSLIVGEAGAGAGLETVRLFETAFRCLAALGPRAIVADDLQWVDSQSLALLHYLMLAAHTTEAPMYLLCASRPSPEIGPFAASLREPLAGERFAEVELRPLALDEAVELVRTRAPRLARDAAERLWRKAGGSPFWLAALADEQGEATSGHLIRGRFKGLGVDAAQLFALLLVAAEPLSIAGATELLDWEEARVGRAAIDLVNRALALREGGTVRIAHDLIREAAADELPGHERRRLHRRLAEWLEAAAGEDVLRLSRALRHREASRLGSDELALRIARSPQRRLLGSEGLAMLGGIADAAIDGAGLALELEVAALASELGEWAVALERWEALADRLRTGNERAQASLAAANAAFRLGRPNQVHAFAAAGREQAPGDTVLAIEADVLGAQALLWLESRVAEAQPVVDRAIAAAERLVEQAGGVDALDDTERVAYVRALRAKLDAAIRQADAETVRQCAGLIEQAARDPAEVLAAASDGVFSLLQFDGAPHAAEARAHRALAESRRLALPSLEVEATHWVGWIAHHRGRLDEASKQMQQAVVLATRVGAPRRFTVPILRALAHGVEASRGDWRGNLAAIERAIDAEPDPHFRLVVRIIHVWLVGRFAAPGTGGLEELLPAMAADAEIAGCGRCLWESVLHGAEASARIGDVPVAEAALREWDASHPKPGPGPAARRAYTAALLAARRDPEASVPLFVRAGALADDAGHELMRLWIDLDAAVALAELDRQQAVAGLRTVARAAEEMGAFSEQQLAVQRLRGLGIHTWQRGPTAEGRSLTRREREIAELVAAGASNPEVAQALFLSRKTVERHLSHVFAKLGARNRVELAVLLEREREGAAG